MLAVADPQGPGCSKTQLIFVRMNILMCSRCARNIIDIHGGYGICMLSARALPHRLIYANPYQAFIRHKMTQTPLKILLPIDIAHVHPEIFPVISELLPLKKSQARLLYVREEMPAYETMLGTMADFPTDLPNQIELKAKEVLAEQTELLKPYCAEVSSEVALGPAAMTIESVAKSMGIDLIVMTPGSHSKVSQYLIGSTCERVAKHARMSVLIVRSTQPVPLKNVVVGIDGSDGSSSGYAQSCGYIRSCRSRRRGDTGECCFRHQRFQIYFASRFCGASRRQSDDVRRSGIGSSGESSH